MDENLKDFGAVLTRNETKFRIYHKKSSLGSLVKIFVFTK